MDYLVSPAIVKDKRFFTSSGDKFHLEYSPVVREDGSLTVEVSGRVDIQSRINSFRDSTDMSFIVNRLLHGDDSVLDHRKAFYGDFTQMPKTLAEVLQLGIDAEKNFYSLPLDVRNSFGNDFRKWFASAGSDDWLDKMKFSPPQSDTQSDTQSEI